MGMPQRWGMPFFFWGGIVTQHDFRLHLRDVQHAAIDAQRAREALEEAAHGLTRVSSPNMETHVSSGSVAADALCSRVFGYQQQREAALSRLRRSLDSLNRFRSELQASPLRDIACRALWLRHALGQSYDRIAAEYPGFINQYLEGDFSPEELAEFGINGFDYNSKAVLKDSTIVDRAHALGMSTNVWTVNKPEKMRKFIDLGIDAITTNEPLVLRDLLGEKEFKK